MAIDLTPQRMKCAVSMACPSVHRLEDGRLLIIGKRARLKSRTLVKDEDDVVAELGSDIVRFVGMDEAAIVIDADLLENVKCQASDVQTGTGSAPSAFQSTDSAEALATKLTDEIMELYYTGCLEKTSVFLCADIAFREATGACRPMTGILGTLTEEQKEAALAYDGPEFLGGEVPSLRSSDERSADADPAIVSDPAVCGGRPVFHGTRFPVMGIVEMMADGYDAAAIKHDFPEITDGHIRAAMRHVLLERGADDYPLKAELLLVPALLEAASRGLPPDVQELLVHGNATRGIPSGILLHMLRAAVGSETGEAVALRSSDERSAEAEELVVLRRRIAILTEKYETGYSQGYSDGYRQAEFDCEAMGEEAFLKAAHSPRPIEEAGLPDDERTVQAPLLTVDDIEDMDEWREWCVSGGNPPSGLADILRNWSARASQTLAELKRVRTHNTQLTRSNYRLMESNQSLQSPSEFKRQIEEARSADERTAEHQSARLTPNTPQEAHSASRTAEDVSPAGSQPQDG